MTLIWDKASSTEDNSQKQLLLRPSFFSKYGNSITMIQYWKHMFKKSKRQKEEQKSQQFLQILGAWEARRDKDVWNGESYTPFLLPRTPFTRHLVEIPDFTCIESVCSCDTKSSNSASKSMMGSLCSLEERFVPLKTAIFA
jgi:hypothetical protein